MTSPKNLFVLIGQEDLKDCYLELVTVVRKLADGLDEKVCCVTLGKVKASVVKELGDYGADKVFFINSPMLSHYSAETAEFYIESVSNLLEVERPRKLFFAHNQPGADLACRLAARMNVGLITGCVRLTLGEDKLIVYSKPTYEGRMLSTFVYPYSVLEIATVKSDIGEKEKYTENKTPEIQSVKPELDSITPRVKTLGIVKADPDEIGLDEADVIVTGGRGMGSAENFKILHKLAKLLGGTVAGSLAAVDEGWIPRKKLVGQTGMTVEPKLYIACGVSGSIYHLMGMRDSKAIIAINNDRYAPIFKYADFGIVGDVMEVIPSIANRLGKTTDRSASSGTASDV
jgi:electron transfer flavoprotein alpha subunit